MTAICKWDFWQYCSWLNVTQFWDKHRFWCMARDKIMSIQGHMYQYPTVSVPCYDVLHHSFPYRSLPYHSLPYRLNIIIDRWILKSLLTALSICRILPLSVRPSDHPSICPFIHLPVHSSVHPPVHPSVQPPVKGNQYFSVNTYQRRYTRLMSSRVVSLHLCKMVYPSVDLSVYHSIFHPSVNINEKPEEVKNFI